MYCHMIEVCVHTNPNFYLTVINPRYLSVYILCIVPIFDSYRVKLKMQIFVKVLKGGTITLDVETDFRVAEVKEMVAFMTEADTDRQSVFCSDKQLDDDTILSDVPIKPQSTLSMKERLVGGSTLNSVLFPDITSDDNFKERNFGQGPIWKSLGKGLNFRGTCRTPRCPASNQIVYVRKGFYPACGDNTEGFCNLSKEIFRMECPMCEECLQVQDICGLSIRKCSLRIKGRVVGMDEYELTVESRGHCYKRALSMCDNSKRVYNYLELTVTPLTDLNPPNDPRSLNAPMPIQPPAPADPPAPVVPEPEPQPETQPDSGTPEPEE